MEGKNPHQSRRSKSKDKKNFNFVWVKQPKTFIYGSKDPPPFLSYLADNIWSKTSKERKILSFHKPSSLRVDPGDQPHLQWDKKMLKEEGVFSFCSFSISLCYTRSNRQSSKPVLKLPLPHGLAFNRKRNTIPHANGKTLIAFNLQT